MNPTEHPHFAQGRSGDPRVAKEPKEPGTISQQLKNLNETLNAARDRANTLRSQLNGILVPEPPPSETKECGAPRRDCEMAEEIGGLHCMATDTLTILNDLSDRLDL